MNIDPFDHPSTSRESRQAETRSRRARTAARFHDDYKPFKARNAYSEDGELAGGFVDGTGLQIVWQDGPITDPEERPSGTFVESVLEAALQRLDFYLDENPNDLTQRAAAHVAHAIGALNERREIMAETAAAPAENAEASPGYRESFL